MAIEFLDILPGGPANGGRPISQELTDFIHALRENPGQWARYPRPLQKTSANLTRQLINSGQAAAFRGGGFRAAVRGGQLYVQYTGRSDG